MIAPAPMPIVVASSPLVAGASCDHGARHYLVLLVPRAQRREAESDHRPSRHATGTVDLGDDAGQLRTGRQHVSAVNRDGLREFRRDRIFDGAGVGCDRARQGQRQRRARGNRHLEGTRAEPERRCSRNSVASRYRPTM